MAQTVFIIGAGISKTAGAPLMNDFLDVADQLRKGPNFGDTDFDLVFRGRDALQSVLAKATMDLLNLESVFAAFEMAKLLRRLGALPTEGSEGTCRRRFHVLCGLAAWGGTRSALAGL